VIGLALFLELASHWLVEPAETDAAQRLTGALGRFWFYRGYLTESATWMERVLALPNGDRRRAGRSKCLWGCAGVSLSWADYARVERLGQEARALWHDLGNTGVEGFALLLLGFVARLRGYIAAPLATERPKPTTSGHLRVGIRSGR
jgi:hypothetical protein